MGIKFAKYTRLCSVFGMEGNIDMHISTQRAWATGASLTVFLPPWVTNTTQAIQFQLWLGDLRVRVEMWPRSECTLSGEVWTLSSTRSSWPCAYIQETKKGPMVELQLLLDTLCAASHRGCKLGPLCDLGGWIVSPQICFQWTILSRKQGLLLGCFEPPFGGQYTICIRSHFLQQMPEKSFEMCLSLRNVNHFTMWFMRQIACPHHPPKAGVCANPTVLKEMPSSSWNVFMLWQKGQKQSQGNGRTGVSWCTGSGDFGSSRQAEKP